MTIQIFNNEHFKNIQEILVNVGEVIEGNLLCDIEPTNIVNAPEELAKIKNLQYLCKNKKRFVKLE